MITHRPATIQELIDGYATSLKYGWRVSFRHFLMELPAPRALHGVQHRDHSTAKLRIIDGVPFVKHHGKLQEVCANIADLGNGKTAVYDLRIKSEYLK